MDAYEKWLTLRIRIFKKLNNHKDEGSMGHFFSELTSATDLRVYRHFKTGTLTAYFEKNKKQYEERLHEAECETTPK